MPMPPMARPGKTCHQKASDDRGQACRHGIGEPGGNQERGQIDAEHAQDVISRSDFHSPAENDQQNKTDQSDDRKSGDLVGALIHRLPLGGPIVPPKTAKGNGLSHYEKAPNPATNKASRPLGGLEHGHYWPQVSIENNRRSLQPFCLPYFRFIAAQRQLSAMELDGEIRVFQQMSCQDQDH